MGDRERREGERNLNLYTDGVLIAYTHNTPNVDNLHMRFQTFRSPLKNSRICIYHLIPQSEFSFHFLFYFFFHTGDEWLPDDDDAKRKTALHIG